MFGAKNVVGAKNLFRTKNRFYAKIAFGSKKTIVVAKNMFSAKKMFGAKSICFDGKTKLFGAQNFVPQLGSPTLEGPKGVLSTVDGWLLCPGPAGSPGISLRFPRQSSKVPQPSFPKQIQKNICHNKV